jgi:hypothetical protein
MTSGNVNWLQLAQDISYGLCNQLHGFVGFVSTKNVLIPGYKSQLTKIYRMGSV